MVRGGVWEHRVQIMGALREGKRWVGVVMGGVWEHRVQIWVLLGRARGWWVWLGVGSGNTGCRYGCS